MVLEETTKYDNGKHYTRKEGRKAGRKESRQGGSEGGAAAIWWRANGVANTTVDAGCNVAKCWERTRESKQTELLADEAED